MKVGTWRLGVISAMFLAAVLCILLGIKIGTQEDRQSAPPPGIEMMTMEEAYDVILKAYATIGWQHEQLGEASRLIGTYRELLDAMAEQYRELVELCRE